MIIDFFRRADWLNDERVRGYSWLLALLSIGLLGLYLATASNGIDRNGFLVGTDFISFWTAGHMLHRGGDVYDIAAHIAAQQRYFVQEHAHTAFFYPPLFLPFCYLLGFLPYFPALAAWLAATGSAYYLTVREWFRQAGPGRFHWRYLAGFPPVLIMITHGQTTFLVATLLGLGALLVPTRPVAAGLLLGLAAIKPQFGLMVPIVLLLTGQWRTIFAALASAAALALVATLAFGMQIWPGWLATMGPAATALENGSIGYAKMQSLFAAAMLAGASVETAWLLQSVQTVLVALLLARASWRRTYDARLAAAMLTGGLLATPFLLDYDLVLLAFPLIVLAGAGFRSWEKSIAMLAFIAPVFARPLAIATGMPIMPPVLLALFFVLIRQSAAATQKGDSFNSQTSAVPS
jgi:Glycosyltransferase family 87